MVIKAGICQDHSKPGWMVYRVCAFCLTRGLCYPNSYAFFEEQTELGNDVGHRNGGDCYLAGVVYTYRISDGVYSASIRHYSAHFLIVRIYFAFAEKVKRWFYRRVVLN